MGIATVLLFLSLGLDTLAVSVGLGLAGLPRARWLRVGLTFAFFEGLMPVAGLLLGQTISSALGEIAGYLAAGILVVIGGLAIREALTADADEDAAPAALATEGPRLLLTGLSVSLDELAVGFSLGVLHVALGPALVYIAVQALAVTFAGLAVGRRAGARLGSRAELAAGVVLTLLGLGLLVEQWTSGGAR